MAAYKTRQFELRPSQQDMIAGLVVDRIEILERRARKFLGYLNDADQRDLETLREIYEQLEEKS